MPDEKVKWPSNSNASKNEQDTTPEKREAPKLKGTASVKKKNLATKFAEAFVADDVKNVGKSLVYDILIPAIKDTISKMVSNGVDSMLFGGEKRRGDVYRDRERTFITDYSGASKKNRDNRSSPRGRTADFSDVMDVCYDYREDAEEILRNLKADIADYDLVSVKAYAAYAKLKDLHFDYPMADYGWNDLSDAYIDRYRDGYHLILPRPKLIR